MIPEHSPSIARLSLNWTERTNVQTRNGIRILLTARLTDPAFWTIWRREKEELKEQGYAPNRAFDDSWLLNRWLPMDGIVANAPQQAAEPPLIDIEGIDTTGLLPWQIQPVAAIIKAISKHGVCLDASDVGTGKTYSALAAFKHLGLQPTVVCPLAVIPSWHRAAKHFGITIQVVNYERLKTGKTEHGKWQATLKTHFAWSKSNANMGLIFDEVHRCKSMVSQNSKFLIAAATQNIPTLCLSATAFTSPLEMKAIGLKLGLFTKSSEHYKWCLSNGCEKGRFGMEFIGGTKTLRRIHSDIFPEKGTRVRIAQLGDAFPESFITTQAIPVSEEGGKRINEAIGLAREMIERIEQKQARDTDNVLTALLRARQISEAEKMPVLADMIADSVEQGQSVVVFLNFSESVASLKEACKSLGGISVVQGGQTEALRAQSIDMFQSDKNRIMLANIDAGGVGISLHDLNGSFPRIAFISPSWSATAMRQALGRVHRANGKTKSTQKILYAADTVEVDILETVSKKLTNLDTLNDGDLA